VMDVYDVLDKYGIEPDYYVPSIDELTAEYVMSEALRTIPGAPWDAQASEEPGYGLPEYSLYYGADARSWDGRWYWSEGGSGNICWGFIPEESICRRIDDIRSKLEQRARRRGRELLFAVWEAD